MSFFTDVRDQVVKDTGLDQYTSSAGVAGAVEGIGRTVGDTVKGSGSPSPSPAAASTPISQAAAVVKANPKVFILAGGALLLLFIMSRKR